MTVITGELTDRQFEIADAIDRYVNDRPGYDFNANQLARAGRCPTYQVYPVLNWMAAENYIAVTGRGGCWIRYTRREAGHYNPGTI